jgi:Ca2+-binding EF-hand superfamily protein
MKSPHFRSRSITLLIALATTAGFAGAQDRRPEGERERERRPEGGMVRMNPLFAALDTNGDGVIDAEELAAATASLQKLDRNHDGKLTEDEVRPAFGGRGPGGPGGPGMRGGPGGPGGMSVDDIVARMMQFDKNADGKLSKDELPERMAGMMERGDVDKDGFLTRDELVKLAQAQAARGGPGGERGRGREDGERR